MGLYEMIARDEQSRELAWRRCAALRASSLRVTSWMAAGSRFDAESTSFSCASFFSSESASVASFFSSSRFLRPLFCWISWIAFTNFLYSSSRSAAVYTHTCNSRLWHGHPTHCMTRHERSDLTHKYCIDTHLLEALFEHLVLPLERLQLPLCLLEAGLRVLHRYTQTRTVYRVLFSTCQVFSNWKSNKRPKHECIVL